MYYCYMLKHLTLLLTSGYLHYEEGRGLAHNRVRFALLGGYPRKKLLFSIMLGEILRDWISFKTSSRVNSMKRRIIHLERAYADVAGTCWSWMGWHYTCDSRHGALHTVYMLWKNWKHPCLLRKREKMVMMSSSKYLFTFIGPLLLFK